MRFSILLLASAAFVAPCAAQTATTSDDQSAQNNQAFSLGQIIVNAPTQPGIAIGSSTLSSEAIYTFNRNTLDDAASLIPGVVAGNTGGSRNERLLSVRGFNRFQVPLSIDGIRVFLPADNRLDYGRFLTPDIAEIQVAKGYASVLNGPDAMGGAVNLVTRKPTKAFEAEVRGTIGLDRDFDYASYNIFGLAGTRQDKWYAQASFARNVVDHWDLASGFQPTVFQGKGERNLSNSHDWRVNAKAGFTPNATDEYSISYTKQKGAKLAPLSTNPGDTQRFWTWPIWNIESIYFLSTTALGDKATLKTRVYRNKFYNLLRSFDNANENTQTLGRAFNSYYKDEAWGGSAELGVDLTEADHFSLAGFYRRDKHVEYQQGFPNGVTEPHQTSIEETYSIAAENVLTLSPQLTFTAGVSYDWKNLLQAQDYANNAFVIYPIANRSGLNGQGKLVWTPEAGTEFHASISDRLRFPTLFERFSSRFGGAVSNAGLKPERAVNYEIGGSRQFGIVHAEGAVFYSHLTDVIVSFPLTFMGQAVTQSRNLGHGNYYGAEGAVSAKLMPSLSVGANYTYTHRDLKDPTNAAFRPTDVPTHKAFIYADWAPISVVHVVPSLDIASNRWTSNALAAVGAGTIYYRTGSYVDAGLRVDWEVYKGIDVGVGGRNLFDQNYKLADGFPEPGRTFYASIRARY